MPAPRTIASQMIRIQHAEDDRDKYAEKSARRLVDRIEADRTRRSAKRAAKRPRAAGSKARAPIPEADDAGDEQPGGEMGGHEEKRCSASRDGLKAESERPQPQKRDDQRSRGHIGVVDGGVGESLAFRPC